MPFPVHPHDRKRYEDDLRDFLPEKIIDIHTHVWLETHRDKSQKDRRESNWPDRVAKDSPIEELLETYRLLLPDKQVTPLIFPVVLSPQDDLQGQNEYASRCARTHDVPALIWAIPTWSADELERRILTGGFVGYKSYLTHAPAYLPADEIRIFDTFPHHHLEVLNAHNWILMLHIPRPARLRDPVNLAQIIEIEKRYPRLQLIVAHVGRAYCPEDVGNAFEVLRETKHVLFDFSANTNEAVFEELIRAVGPERILFGSDLPIARMRMRRVCEAGRYVNLVPKGLYGDVSGDPHMREVEGPEAKELSIFLYEEIDAFRRAARATGLTQSDIENVFHRNARRVLDQARTG